MKRFLSWHAEIPFPAWVVTLVSETTLFGLCVVGVYAVATAG